MDKHLERVFVHEVERQAKFALIAAQDFQTALNAHEPDRVWYSAQGFLIAAGNLSKLFWPSGKSATERGQTLRSMFAIPDDSPLAPRTFRNHFEHFDERLEEWAGASRRKNFVDSCIGPPGMIVGIEEEDYLRNLDTQSLSLTFRGDKYAIRPVVAAIERLYPEALRLSRAG